MKAHEELVALQETSAAFAASINAIKTSIANIEIDIARFENYLKHKGVTREDLALTSLRMRKDNLEKSLATLGTRNMQVAEALQHAAAHVAHIEARLREAVSADAGGNANTPGE